MAPGVGERSCRVCRRKADKKALLRLVIREGNRIEADPGQTAPGRGWYLCRTEQCLSILNNPKMLRKVFGRPIQAGTAVIGNAQ
ncbi:MAG: YlxR family protein [Deltaproteobacteria bacterium]|nr:YlxR family protein [Deltaproteobacteria bacterium]